MLLLKDNRMNISYYKYYNHIKINKIVIKVNQLMRVVIVHRLLK